MPKVFVVGVLRLTLEGGLSWLAWRLEERRGKVGRGLGEG